MSGLLRFYHPVVLVVDDNDDVRDTVAHLLTVRGFQVLTASNTENALAVCRSQHGDVDAVVADLSIPGEAAGGLDGVITAECPDVKVVHLTAVPRHVALASGLVRPATPYLQKPVDGDVLASLLRSLFPQFGGKRDEW